jgi:uncharacterized protein (DUF1015 family)
VRVPVLEEAHPAREQVVRALALEVSAIQGAVSQISPFVGLLFDPARVGPLERVTAPPYDTISPAEQRRYLDASPYNVTRLELGEDAPGDDERENKYRRAGAWIRRWIDEGILVHTPRPMYYPYELRFPIHGVERRVRGLVCAVEIEPWGGSIVPHERTMAGPIDDRLRLIREVRANLSCIHAVFGGPFGSLGTLLDGSTASGPVAEMTDEQGVRHRLWTAEPDADVEAWLRERELMIADGHHRYATALEFRNEMHRRHGSGPWDHVMTLIVDASTEDLPVLPYHRIVTAPPAPAHGARVRDLEEVLAEVDDDKLRYGVVALDDAGRVLHSVGELDGEPPTVVALHQEVLAGRDDDLRFTPDAVEAETAVRAGEAAAAIFLPATTAVRIRGIVERGGRLPQKSTFFWPKPRTGLVMRPFDAMAAVSSP